MTPEEQVAELKQAVADSKAEVASLKKALDVRETDNKGARDRIKAIEAELGEAKAAMPAADAVILTGPEAAEVKAYRDLGKLDLVRVKLDDYDRATKETASVKRRELVDKLARDPQDETRYRFKPSVLGKLLTDSTVTMNDKGEATVKTGDIEKPLDKWLEEDQADFLPALNVAPAGTPAARQAGDRRTTPGVTIEQLVAKKRASGEYNA